MKLPSLLRFIRRNSLYYLVNIFGMSVSIAISLVALLFIYRELSTDRFHKDINNIYCVEVDGRANTPFIFAGILKDQLPGVSSFTRAQLWDMKNNVLRYAGNPPVDLDQIIRADTNFFSFFTFDFIKGDPKTCLEKPESLVLTESSARRLFGNDDPMGKNVSYNKGQLLLTVTAVVSDPPFNSSITFNAVMSVNSLPVVYPPFSQPGAFFWSFETFVSVKGVIPDSLMNRKASQIFLASIPSDAVKEAREIFKSRFMVRLIPFSKTYFKMEYSTSLRKGDIKQVYLFSVIGFVIILVALVNYINLSNAGATMRIRNVMIRKTMGASTVRLFTGFLLESVLLSLVVVMLSLILGNILTNIVNNHRLLGHPIEFFSLKGQALILVAGTIITGIAGGLYPAITLASISPSVSRRHQVLSGAVFIRKLLLIFQFFITSSLLICAMVISGQYRLMTEKPAGFDSANIIYMRMGSQLKKNYAPFTDKLRQMPQIVKIANARYGFIGGRNPGRTEFVCNGNKAIFDAISFTTDTGFMEMLGLHLTSGSSFREHDNITHKLIINETALKMMCGGDDLSHIIHPDAVHGVTWQVVGVVKDFNTRSMQYPVSPYVFYFAPGDADMDGLYIKIREGENLEEMEEFITDTSLEFAPDEPVFLQLLEDVRTTIYRDDNNRRKLFLFFSAFTMLISCIGLYALSGFILGRRYKETGIRKVYGAGKRSIILLLSSDMLKIVFIGFMLALPVSWFVMNKWLQGFAVKANPDCWLFVLSGAIVFLIAIFSVSVETAKISGKKVADVLRYE